MAKIFKSIWFKCITVLLSITLVSGGLLAILNPVLAVTPRERTMRSIKKIYGEEKEFLVLLDTDDEERADSEYIYKDANDNELAKISKVYTVAGVTAESYDMLFKSTGGQGYKNGTITLWVKVIYNTVTEKYDIDKVILESFTKQTLMSKLGGSFYDGFKLQDVTQAYFDKTLMFSPSFGATNGNPVSGATMSANAGCNAVNGVIDCIGNKGWN